MAPKQRGQKGPDNRLKISLTASEAAFFQAEADRLGMPLATLVKRRALGNKMALPGPDYGPQLRELMEAIAALNAASPRAIRGLLQHELAARLGGGSAGVERLIQLGGSGPELFEGSPDLIDQVLAVTAAWDPEGQAWAPVGPDRAYWVPVATREDCLALWAAHLPE